MSLYESESPKNVADALRSRFESLTNGERHVLLLITEGKLSKEIAFLRKSSTRTVDAQVQSIINKLGARSRTAAAVLAVAVGDFTPDLKNLLSKPAGEL